MSLVIALALVASRAEALDAARVPAPAAPAPGEVAAPSNLKHAIFAELGGAGLTGSVNYELRMFETFALGLGVGVVPGGLDAGLVPTVNGGARVLLFEGAHHLELGLGALVGAIDDDDAAFFVPVAGYRYQAPEGGLVARVTFSPLFRLNDPSDVLPWGGLSAGWAF